MNHPTENQNQDNNNFIKGFWWGGHVDFMLLNHKTIQAVIKDLFQF